MQSLTENQRRELQQTGELRLVDPATKEEYVVVKAAVFDNLKRVLGYDDSPWKPAERRSLLESFGEKAGWDGSEFDIYEECRNHVAPEPS